MKKLTINQFVQRYQEIDGPRGAEDFDYKSHVAWDSPILAVCREYPTHMSFAEVRCKVGYVNRLYKCILGGVKDLLSWELDDVESRVAKAFIDQSADAIMADLGKLPEFSNATLMNIVCCHTKLVKIVASAINYNQPVFCSKYASFHFPQIVPILDSKSERTAKQLVNELSGANTSVEEDDWEKDENGLKRYENHCANLLMLINLLRRNGIARPSLKKLDHVLYW
jgi:hypothetical protein